MQFGSYRSPWRSCRPALIAAALLMNLHARAQDTSERDRPADIQSAMERPNATPQGRAILGAAWKHRRETDDRPDCSHLVHEIYELAGYPYPYAPSGELYDGVEQFQRVSSPEAGDLIVWPGHVGIVVDPVARSFYSSERSGLKIDFYDNRWWRRLRQPRFYRYSAPGTLSASNAGRIEAGQPTVAKGSDGDARTETRAPSVDPVASAASVPPDTRVQLRGAKPTKATVLEAIQRMTRSGGQEPDAEKDLRGEVVDRITVKRVSVSGAHGIAQVQIVTRANVTTKSVQMRKAQHAVRVDLEKSGRTWFADLAGETNFISTDVAVAALSAHLTDMAQANAAREEQQKVVNALQALLRK
jgi:hypothetical protein